jgi:serine/threonine-protein kinase
MEYVEGENLSALMARERVPADRAVAIVKAVAGALDHAHQAGVVHRDVKPANILVAPGGEAKLVDLGIATATERTQITAAGTVLGTPSYMAPEQFVADRISKAVDIYALGAVAFELLAGHKARQGRTPVEIAHHIANDPVPDIREAWSDAPPAAAQVLRRAMSRDPADRQATAGELARGLEDAFRDVPPDTLPPTERFPAPIPFQRDDRPLPPRSQRASAPPPRRPAAAARRPGLPRWIPVAALVAVLLVVAGAVVALSSGGQDKGTAPVVAVKKPKPAKKKTAAQPQPQQAQTSTAPAQTQAQTTPAPPASSDPAAMQAQAHNLINQGQYDQAIALDQQVVDKGPSTGLTYAYALYDLGHALRLAGRPADAIPVLEQRMKINNQRDVVKAELEQAKKEAKKG